MRKWTILIVYVVRGRQLADANIGKLLAKAGKKRLFPSAGPHHPRIGQMAEKRRYENRTLWKPPNSHR
jgi:hypothetical protein